MASCTGAEVKIIYVNLQRLGAVSQGVAEVLIAISDEIASALNISAPDDDALLKLPQRTFERYLKQVIGTMSHKGLIIALDEFETIEELIERGQIEPSFMGFLRGLVQMNPEKIAFAFAGLHTLEEMTADYFQPFFASVIAIPISFLSKGATKTIVANPIADQSNSLPQSPLNPHLSKSLLSGETSDVSPSRGDKEGLGDFQAISQAHGANINSFLTEIEANQNSDNHEFLLDYTGEALDLIYSLTSGQPYLTQLIGFLLVRNYNDQVFEQGNTQDNTLTVEDIEAVINSEFFQQGRYYFEGVWGQATQGATGQQAILKPLASYPQGMSEDELLSVTGLDSETLEAALATLIRHDVIEKKDHNYRIIVELFRQWVLNMSS
ncbi:MAG: ATP-binding protein [Xenococcus sp. (in: cyanobacteria)]